MYDYLIIGAGIYGSCFAFKANESGKKVLVIDKRSHLGGNIYCENIKGINVHKYGAHIFHTSNKKVWDFVNSFVEFNRYTNSPLANYRGKLYNLPFNMNTFYTLWGTKTPAEVKARIEQQRQNSGIIHPKNLEEQAISLVGQDIYNTLIKEYTEKQWGRKATDLPSFIIKRIPIRFTFDNNYFNDLYQGIPIGGYNILINGLLKNIETQVNTNFFDNREYFTSIAQKIVYTGPIDEFYNYCYGKLAYRSLRFEEEILDCPNYQGNAVINYIDSNIPYTRIIEHKHFEFGQQTQTVISKEYPVEWKEGCDPYYPINDDTNMHLYKKYQELSLSETNIIFGGRLAEYRYYDVHQIIEKILNLEI